MPPPPPPPPPPPVRAPPPPAPIGNKNKNKSNAPVKKNSIKKDAVKTPMLPPIPPSRDPVTDVVKKPLLPPIPPSRDPVTDVVKKPLLPPIPPSRDPVTDTVKKAAPPPPPPPPPLRDLATHLMHRGSMNGPETAPKPTRRPSQESVGAPEVLPKPKRQSSQDGRPPSVNSNGRPPSVNSRPPSVNNRPPSVNSHPPSRPPSVPKRQSSTQLSDSSPVSDNPSPPMMLPRASGIPVPPPPPPLPINEAVYESVDSLVASGSLQAPPLPKSLASQSNVPINDNEEDEALYDFIPPPAVKPKPKRTSTISSIQSSTSDITITKAERDAIRRVSAVITDELLQQDEQLARASFHPTIGDTEAIDDDIYDDLEGAVYDDTVGANEKVAQFKQSMSNNAPVVPKPPVPPPIPGYNNDDEVYEDTVTAGEKAMEYKQHVMPNSATSPLDTNAVYEEPKPPAPPPPPPVVPPSVSHQQVPPKAPPPPPVVQPFVPDQVYDELPPKAPAATPSFVPDQDYDELPPPKASQPPPVIHPFVPDQDYDELPPPKPPAAPPVASVPDQDYDELPPTKAAVFPQATDQDYDDLPPPRPAMTQSPAALEQDDMIYDQLPPAPKSQAILAPKSQLPLPSQVVAEDQIYDSLPAKDTMDTALEADIYDVLPPKAAATAVAHADMDYDEVPPAPTVSNTGYATVQKNRSVEQKSAQPDAMPELDMLGQLVQDAPRGDGDEFNALGSVLSNMGASEDKSSSDEGKWDLPSGDDEEDEGEGDNGTKGDDDLLDDWLNDLNSTYPTEQNAQQQNTTRPSSAKLANKYASWRMSMAAFTEAVDPDLDSLLADLCKLEEETAAAAAVGDTTRPPTVFPGETDQMSGEEFASFMQSLQQSKNIIHDPISLAIYDTVKQKDQPSQHPSKPNEPEQHKEQKNVNELRRANKPAPLQHSGHLDVQRPPSLSTPLSPSHEQVQQQLELFAQQLELDESLTPVEKEKRLQTEKIRIAMNKLKEARIKKMVLKAISIDGSSKMAVVDENMNARDSCMVLAEKNHQNFGPNWTLVERLDGFELERPLEDHERVIDALSHWPKVHRNTVHFRNNPNKYLLLTRPQMLVPDSHSLSAAKGATYFSEEKKKNMILNEMFKEGNIPKVEGELYFKDGKRAGWKKHLFGIRTSGFYMSKSGKSMSSKDVQRVATWSEVFVYNGTKDFKKHYKAPSNLHFSLVPMGPIEKAYGKIKHFCLPAGTKHDLDVWMTGIRIAKFGKNLMTDYETTKEKCPWMQLEEDEEVENEKKGKEDPTLDLNTATEEELNALRTDIVQKVTEVTKKSKFGSVSLRFQSTKTSLTTAISKISGANLNVPAGGKPPSTRTSQTSIDQPDAGHVITGPVITGPVGASSTGPVINGPASTGSTRSRQAKQRSVLKEAFKNAWKQGNISTQVGGYGEELWPTFSTKPAPVFVMEDDLVEDSPKLGHKRFGDSASLSGEMSGMVTLKRGKKAKDAAATREDEQAAQGNSSPSQGTPSDAQSISSDSNSLVFQMHKEMEGQDKRASTVSIETAI